MNFFKAMRFRLSQKLKIDGTDPENNQMPWEELKDGSMKPVQKIGAADESSEEEYDEDDDDDENHEDFGSNVVKRRLMETRKNSFMVLIPEESNLEEEEETSSSEWRELEVEDGYHWSEFDTLYIRYCERMLFFVQSMKEAGSVHKTNGSGYLYPPVLAVELLNIVEGSILTFHDFLKRDKKKSSAALSLFKGQRRCKLASTCSSIS